MATAKAGPEIEPLREDVLGTPETGGSAPAAGDVKRPRGRPRKTVPAKTTDPAAGPEEQWTPTPPPIRDSATDLQKEQYLTQLAVDLTRSMQAAAGDVAAVLPTAGVILSSRAESASRGLVAIGRLIPGGPVGLGALRVARDGTAVLGLVVSFVVGALVDLARIPPDGKLAQRTGVTDAFLAVQSQREQQRQQLAAMQAPTATAAWGVPTGPTQPMTAEQQAAQHWAWMQAQSAQQVQQGPPRTVFRGGGAPGW